VRLYPELLLKKSNFLNPQEGKSARERKKFFDWFARSQKFNPLDAEKWYSVSYDDIKRAVSSHHQS